MEFDKWIKEQLEGEGLKGKVIYNEDEDSYQLSMKAIDIGLCNPLWQDYENKEITIKIQRTGE